MKTPYDVPKAILRCMLPEDLRFYLQAFKRARRRYIAFALNGCTICVPRKEAVALVEATLQQVEAQR